MAGALMLVALTGCDGAAPPLDELPLRDALRADPAVIATLSDDARQQLAARLEAARTGDGTSDPVAGDPDATQPAMLLAQVDAARAQRSGDALIVGIIASGTARALPNVSSGASAPLPPLEVEATAPALTALESRALQGKAATPVRGLLAASGAQHLRRVVGWPTGAVAIGDTVYVGAAWLAALAPAISTDGGADAGAAAPRGAATTTDVSGANAAALGAATTYPSGGSDSPDAGGIRATAATDDVGAPSPGRDAGVVVVYPPTPTTPPPPTSTDDSCGAGAGSCAACGAASTDDSDSCDGNPDDGSGDSCDNTSSDGTDNSCDNTSSDGTDNSCSNTSSDGTDDTNCQVSRGRPHHGGTSTRMMLSLFAPLGFLLSRRRQ